MDYWILEKLVQNWDEIRFLISYSRKMNIFLREHTHLFKKKIDFFREQVTLSRKKKSDIFLKIIWVFETLTRLLQDHKVAFHDFIIFKIMEKKVFSCIHSLIIFVKISRFSLTFRDCRFEIDVSRQSVVDFINNLFWKISHFWE